MPQRKETCKVSWCKKTKNDGHMCAGYCGAHYQAWYRLGMPGDWKPDRPKVRPNTCSIPGCEYPHEASGYCKDHVRAWRRVGRPVPWFQHSNAHPEGWKNLPKPKPCKSKGCDGRVYCKGYCRNCYQGWTRAGRPEGWVRPPRRGEPGFVEHSRKPKHGKRGQNECCGTVCEQPHYASGYCSNHYDRWRLKGCPGGWIPVD